VTENLQGAQRKMKVEYGKRARHRVFSQGDKIFLPLPGSALQANYQGPYSMVHKVGEVCLNIGPTKTWKKSRTILMLCWIF